MPTNVAIHSRFHTKEGTSVAVSVRCQSGRARKAVTMYAKSTAVSHFRYRANTS
jgi:hypothetical protein